MQPNQYRPGEGNPGKFTQVLWQPAWTALVPASIVAVGGAEQPVERLLPLQSAIARIAHAAATLGGFRLRLPRRLSPSARFR